MVFETPFEERYVPTVLQENHESAKASAAAVVPLLLAALPGIHSVVDIGCGLGTWLAEFRDRGIRNVRGVDGDWVDAQQLAIPWHLFTAMDLRHPWRLAAPFDLALCLEVAEHLPEKYANGLVTFLTTLAPVIFFSAAYPGQGGHYHENEKSTEYWQGKFATHDYLPEPLPGLAETGPAVQFWYANGYILRRQEARR